VLRAVARREYQSERSTTGTINRASNTKFWSARRVHELSLLNKARTGCLAAA